MISKKMTKAIIERAEKTAPGKGIDKRLNMLLEMLYGMLKEMIKRAGHDLERLEFENNLLIKIDKRILYPLIVEEEGPVSEIALKGYPFSFEPMKITPHRDKIFIPILIDKNNITCHFFGFITYQQLMSKSIMDFTAGWNSNRRVIKPSNLAPFHELIERR